MGLISRVSSRTYRSGSYQHETNMADAEQPQARPISKKHLFVRDGLFKSEADEFFKRELAEDGYSGIVVRKSKTCEIIIIATRPSQVLGDKTRRIRELTAIVNKRWGAEQGQIDLYVERVANRGEVIVSGKIRGQRAKAMKFNDGMMIHSGNPVKEYVDTAVRHVQLRQGMLGIKVKILKPHDSEGLNGPKTLYPDIITIMEPKEEKRPEADKGKTV